MVFNPEFNFLFIHIQKTAGTSITKALLNIPSSEFIAPPHLKLKDISFKSESRPFIFTVVRNPWTRLASWYEMMLRKGAHNDFSRYLLGSNHNRLIPITFSEFIRRIEIIEENEISEVAQNMMGSIREHFQVVDSYTKSISFNQADYLTDTQNFIKIDRVLRFESIESDWANLVGQLKLPLSSMLTHENVNPNLKNYRRYYSNPQDINWVGELYQRDIQLFDYKIPIW